MDRERWVDLRRKRLGRAEASAERVLCQRATTADLQVDFHCDLVGGESRREERWGSWYWLQMLAA